MPRFAILLDHPVQHFAPGFRLLAARADLDTRVYYWQAALDGLPDPGFGQHIQWNTDLHSDYPWWSPPSGRTAQRCAALWRRLRADRHEAILSFGWASPAARTGIAYATATGTPLLYFGDSNWKNAATGRYPWLRRRILRRLFTRAAGAVGTGTFNREFYLCHGMPPERVLPGVYPCDVDTFAAIAGTRTRPLVIAFVGKFINIKGADELISAAAELPRDQDWQLWLIGDGPQRPALEAQAEAAGLAARVRFLGFLNTDELPQTLRRASIVVMPSRKEPRGLVAIEAMATGAAVVVSSSTGVWGPGDALQHEETGLVYQSGDVGGLAKCLRRLMEDPALRRRLGTAAKTRALGFGPAAFADTAAAALLSTVRAGHAGQG